MKKLTLVLMGLFAGLTASAQCNVNSATTCVCEVASQTNCDLLPDMTLSWWAIQNYQNGPTEFAQTGNGANNGRLRITGSTPNIGRGSFTVRGIDDLGKRWFVCGTDTISITDPNFVVDFTCPTSGQTARQLLLQRVYHKNGNAMTYSDRFTGTMTYHPTHYHNHVDDWVVFTLRLQDPLEMDPRNWPIIGDGAKVGFCLMDFGTCSNYNGHCRTDNTISGQGTILASPSDFPNYGLGGGSYNCSPIEQGISVGYTDIYSEDLDGMWIDIPPGTCNGNYWIVGEVDPHNVFHESNDNNNWTAVPVTLTQQAQSGGSATITASSLPGICPGQSLTLTANPGTAYSWSTGATTRTITVNTPGNYAVQVTNQCGVATSAPLAVSVSATVAPPAAIADTTCQGSSASLSIQTSANQTINWYSSTGQFLQSGPVFSTPPLLNSTNYLASIVEETYDSTLVGPVTNTIGAGGYLASNQGLIFNVYSHILLKSVKVYAQTAGPRTILLQSSTGTILATANVTVPTGESRVYLNFDIEPGIGYRLTSSNANLYRNTSGVNYPYTVAGIVSITTSTASTSSNSYYYYFYDWEVLRKVSSCESPMAPVTAVALTPAMVSFTGLNTAYYSNSSSSSVLTGSPAGGVFSGPGITGNIFNPLIAGVGQHSIVYTYHAQGCSISTTQQTQVNNFVGMPDAFDFNQSISVYPNPAKGEFIFEVNAPGAVKLEIALVDIVGRTLMQVSVGDVNGMHLQKINTSGITPGTYLVKATIGGKNYIRKINLQ